MSRTSQPGQLDDALRREFEYFTIDSRGICARYSRFPDQCRANRLVENYDEAYLTPDKVFVYREPHFFSRPSAFDLPSILTFEKIALLVPAGSYVCRILLQNATDLISRESHHTTVRNFNILTQLFN